MTGTDPQTEVTFWSLAVQGGWLMIPIGLCSLVGVAYALERFIHLRLSRIMPARLVAGLREAIARRDYEGAKALCKKDHSPFAQIVLAGLRELGLDWERVEKAVEDAGLLEIAVFRQNVRPLRIISEIAPLLGLLGTIQGMMGAFRSISAGSGQLGKTEMFAGDIFLALITTAAGLLVAIPALFLSHHFSGRIDRIALQMNRTLGDLLAAIRDQESAAAGTTAPKAK